MLVISGGEYDLGETSNIGQEPAVSLGTSHAMPAIATIFHVLRFLSFSYTIIASYGTFICLLSFNIYHPYRRNPYRFK